MSQVRAQVTEWRAEVRRGGGDFHYLLLRVSQQVSGTLKLTLLPLPHKPQIDSRYVEMSIVQNSLKLSYLFTYFLAVSLIGMNISPMRAGPQHLAQSLACDRLSQVFVE